MLTRMAGRVLSSIEPTEAGLEEPRASIMNGHETPITEDEAAFLVSAAGCHAHGLNGNAHAAAAVFR